MRNSNQNQQGFSLVQVLVSVGIAGVVLSAMTSAIINLTQAQDTLQSKQELMTLVQDLQGIFSDPDLCEKSLGTTGVSFDPSLAVANGPGSPFEISLNNGLVRNGQLLDNYRIRVNRFNLTNVELLNDDGSMQNYRASVELDAAPISRPAQGGIDFRTRHVGSLFFSVTSGRIMACSNTSNIPGGEGGGGGGVNCVPSISGVMTRAREVTIRCEGSRKLLAVTWARIHTNGGRTDVAYPGATGRTSASKVKPESVDQHSLRGSCCQ